MQALAALLVEAADGLRSRLIASVRSSRSAISLSRLASTSASSSSARRLTAPSRSRSCLQRFELALDLHRAPAAARSRSCPASAASPAGSQSSSVSDRVQELLAPGLGALRRAPPRRRAIRAPRPSRRAPARAARSASASAVSPSARASAASLREASALSNSSASARRRRPNSSGASASSSRSASAPARRSAISAICACGACAALVPGAALGGDRLCGAQRAPRPRAPELCGGGARLGELRPRLGRRGAGAFERERQLVARRQRGIAASAAALRSAASSRAALARTAASSTAERRVRVWARLRSNSASASRALSDAARAARDALAHSASAAAASLQAARRRRRLGAHASPPPRGLGLALEIAEPVLFGEPPRGRRRRLGGGDEAVPAPEIAFERDQPLAGLQERAEALAVGARDDADLGEPARQRRRRGDADGERLDACRQLRVGAVARDQRPVRRRRLVDRRLEIVAERRPQRRLVAARDADRVDYGGKSRPTPAPKRLARVRASVSSPCAARSAAARGPRERASASRASAWRPSAASVSCSAACERGGELRGGFGAAARARRPRSRKRAKPRARARSLAHSASNRARRRPSSAARGAQRMAARVEVGRGGLRLRELGFGFREPPLRRLFARARFARRRRRAVEGLRERSVLRREALHHAGRVSDQRLLALEVAGELRRAPLELGDALGGALLLGLERGAGEGDAVQGRAAARFLLAQRGQIGGGERLQARRPRLARGCARRRRAGPRRASSPPRRKRVSWSRQAMRWARAAWRRMSAASVR